MEGTRQCSRDMGLFGCAWRLSLVVLLFVCHRVSCSSENPSESERFRVASVDFAHVSTPFIISLWIVIAGLAKIGFHVTPRISLICPESCLLIVIGVIIGFLLHYTGLTQVGPLTPDVFFLFMLPPIVLDAGYYMPNRLFFDNLVTILLFAVIGTVFNALSVGLSLYGVGLTGLYGLKFPLLEALRFGAIACAVDPVAVLAVFEEIHVNDVLYIVVFGESLLNDAVTVVLYHMFDEYSKMGQNIIPVDYVAGVSSFFVVAVCGTLVGIVWGFLAAFVSRFTHHVRVIEPLFVFVMSYLAYVSAELFHLSGILALTFCGITMKNYVEENISYKSHVTVKYAMKMLASCSETIIFLFLGVSTVNDNHVWNTWFVVMTILFCTVYRIVGVMLLTAVANHFRLHRLNRVEQFIMAYGGLRGAVAFALVLVVSNEGPTKDMMVTTVIALVYFTVFVQGMTIGPLVRILNVTKSSKVKPTMNERIHTRLIDHLMAGIEDITGQIMGNYHLRDKFKYYNNKYLRPLLLCDHVVAEPKIFETYSKLNIADAMSMVKNNVSMAAHENGSLAHVFRTFTRANLAEGFGGGRDNPSFDRSSSRPDFLNVDMAELNYSPSYKDVADAELHHILSDAMFKPPRRFRKYSRDHIPDNKSHPPFHHHIRMQIRHLVSENNRHRRRSQPNNYLTVNNNNNNDDTYSRNHSLNTLQLSNIKEIKEKERTTSKVSLASISSETSSSPSQDDNGIIFQVPNHSPQSPNSETSKQTLPDETVLTPVSPTVTETTLPWKRRDDITEDECARIQQEFPSWIDNREYMAYASPTDTLLGKLSGSEEKRPAVFEIFKLDASPVKGVPQKNEEAINTVLIEGHRSPSTSKDGVNADCEVQDTSIDMSNFVEQHTKL
ncbi:Na(+)/H(+) exchanger beta-like [Centruroides sculpturatus]|uniref:Na(+)/H(+) exchanger beta-like n=1 Tax=Centruroides sculpturatus TaxID=218467 RepID=UPI000C6DFFA5|nr:Na(+)/H(+) exchanger beta-like [Centruroides sculpturatus]